MNINWESKVTAYLSKLCTDITERCVGTPGNREAAEYIKSVMAGFGFSITAPPFPCLDWEDKGSVLKAGRTSFQVKTSPFSLPVSVTAELLDASTIDELEALEAENKIILLHGDIAAEQLMPKNFVFYNPDHHKKIISLLESKKPAAIICVTAKNPELAGAVYPFPLIEDGDFDIPSVYMTDLEGEKLLSHLGREVSLNINSKRIAAEGCNVIGDKKGSGHGDPIVVCAHFDSKKGTPGAIDNATGVIILLLLAEMLEYYEGQRPIQLLAFNGEDYYSVPGQMQYLGDLQKSKKSIYLAINIDGAGFKGEKGALSFYDAPENVISRVREVIRTSKQIVEGPQWYQSDHSIFIQSGIPAMAVTSSNFMEKLSIEITHTPKDTPEVVDPAVVAELAMELYTIITGV